MRRYVNPSAMALYIALQVYNYAAGGSWPAGLTVPSSYLAGGGGPHTGPTLPPPVDEDLR